MKSYYSYIFLLLYAVILSTQCLGQEIKVEVERKKITTAQSFLIKVMSRGNKAESIDMPEIEGFKKMPVVSVEFTDEKGIITFGIEQPYRPKQEGIFSIDSLKILVNQKSVMIDPFKVVVTKATVETQKNEDNLSSEESFLDEIIEKKTATPQVSRLDQAFLGLSISKNEAYIGEEVNVLLALYIAKGSTFAPEFDAKQLDKLIKKIKPQHVIEENFNVNLTRIIPTEFTINDKIYFQYKLYQASFFPLEAKKISFPSLELNLIDQSSQDSLHKPLSFKSDPLSVTVKELPEHPLQFSVPVGNILLSESASGQRLTTHKSFVYTIAIGGTGNIFDFSLQPPVSDNFFEFYPPAISLVTRKTESQIIGFKKFVFNIIPKIEGNFAMRDYFRVIYFNTITLKYDTLVPKFVVEVRDKNPEDSTGKDKLNAFYEPIERKELIPLRKKNINNKLLFSNIILVCLFMFVIGYLLWKQSIKK